MRQWLMNLAMAAMAGAAVLAGCSRQEGNPQGGSRKITIGMVAKSQSNDVFQAAYAGAKDAAKELGPRYGATVAIDWRTPVDEDAARQVEAIEALTRAHVDAILVACSNAETVTPAIDRAVDNGVPVMTFDSDAPASKRFCTYGTDDVPAGARMMAELAAAMGDKGTVAILAGNQSAPNLQKRVQGAKQELAKHPNMKLLEASGGVFYHQETPEKAAEAVATATNANPQIQGWCMIGGWPLFTTNALKWEPGKIKVVACDALPAQLSYLKSGHVEVLLAQDCYGWGYKSVQTVLEMLVNKKPPAAVKMTDPLARVTRDNVEQTARMWDKWVGRK